MKNFLYKLKDRLLKLVCLVLLASILGISLVQAQNTNAYMAGSSDSRINISPTAYSLPTVYSISAWIKPSSIPASGYYNTIFGGESADNTQGVSFSVNSGSNLVLRTTTSSGSYNTIGVSSLVLNNWVHVAVVRNDGSVTIYVNGTAVTNSTQKHTSAIMLTSNIGLGIGWAVTPSGNGSGFSACQRFDGKIDDLKFWSGTALTAAEIQNAMFETIPQSATCLAYYKLNGNATNSSTATGKCPDGVLLGTTVGTYPQSDLPYVHWNGGTGAWATASNWSNNTVPTSSNTKYVLINSGTPQISANETCLNLSIAASAGLDIANMFSLTASGSSISNSGVQTSTGNGKVVVSTSGAKVFGEFSGLEVSSAATLAGNLTVNGTLSLVSGNLSIGSYKLTIRNPLGTGTGGFTTTSTSQVEVNGTGSAFTIPALGTINSLTVNYPSGITLGGASTITNLTLSNGVITNGSYLTLATSGSIDLSSGGGLSNMPTFGTTYNLTYSGTSAIVTGNEFSTTPSQIGTLTVNCSGGVTLGANRQINNILAFSNGTFSPGAFDLTLGSSCSITGVFSSTNMLIGDASGRILKLLPSLASSSSVLFFPIGDNDNNGAFTSGAQYSPIQLTFSGVNTASNGQIVVSVANQKSTLNTSANNYLNRSWSITPTGFTSGSIGVVGNYLSSEITGLESKTYSGYHDGSAWNLMNLASSSTITGSINPIINSTNVVTGGNLGTLGSNTAFSLSFNGSSNYITANGAINSAYTIEFWINSTSLPATVLSRGTGTPSLVINSTGSITYDNQTTATGVIQSGKWQHIALVNNSGTTTVYVDGVLVSTSTSSLSSSGLLKIGEGLNGKIDEFRVWNTVRTGQEIADNRFTESPNGTPALYLKANNNLNNAGSSSFSILTSTPAPDYSDLIPYSTWVGTSTAWSVNQNWSSNIIPVDVNPAYVVIASSSNNPILSSNTQISSLVIASSAALTINSGVVLTLTGSIDNKGSYSGSGKITVTGGSELHSFAGIGSYGNIELNDATQNAIVKSKVTIDGTLTLTAGTLTISDKKLTLANAIAGTATNLVSSNASTLELKASGITIPTSITVLKNLILNSVGSLTLATNLSIVDTLSLVATKVVLGTYNLSAPLVLGTFASTNMIVATGTGKLIMPINDIGLFVFPVGDATNYSPIMFNFTAGSFTAASLEVNLANSAFTSTHDLSVVTSYLNRYWNFNAVGTFSNINCVVEGDYITTTDINGTESLLYGGVWDGTKWIYTQAVVSPKTIVTTTSFATTNVLTARDPQAYAKFFTALKFDGSSTHIVASSTQAPVTTYTITAWINLTQYPTAGNYAIIGGGKTTNTITTSNYMDFEVSTAGYLQLRGAQNGTVFTLTSNRQVPLNTWTFVAMSRNNQSVTFYMDSTNQSLTMSANSAPTTNPNYLTIGAIKTISGVSSYFKGSMDEVRYWERSLTKSEIFTYIYRDLEYAATPDVSTSLVGYWKLNGNGNNDVDVVKTNGTSISNTITGTIVWNKLIPYQTWTGEASNDWADGHNWSNKTIPSTDISGATYASPTVVIAPATNQPILNANSTILNLVSLPSSTLTINSGAALTINENISKFTVNQGVVTGVGKILLPDNTTAHVVNGDFSNLELNNTLASTTTFGKVTVGNLNIVTGNVNVFNTLGLTNGTITKPASSRIIYQTTPVKATLKYFRTDSYTGNEWGTLASATEQPYHVTVASGILRIKTNVLKTIGDFKVESGASAYLEATDGYTLGGALTVGGNMIVNGAMTMNSPKNSGIGSSLITLGTISGTGSFTYDRYLIKERIFYISIPVKNVPLATIFDLPTNKDVKRYYEKKVTGIPRWESLTGTESSIAGQGLSFVYPSGKMYHFATNNPVNVNTGVVSSTITNTVSNPPSAVYDGWNLVGNPYPCAVDWTIASGWTRPSVDHTAYVYNSEVGAYQYILDGVLDDHLTAYVNTNKPIIPAFQSFMVHFSVPNGSTSFSINNNARVHDNVYNLKMYKKANTSSNILKMTLEGNNFTNEAMVRFNDEATVDFDGTLDAYYLPPMEGSRSPQLYSMSAQNSEMKMAINSLPMNNDVNIIPLGFTAPVDGYYSVSFNDFTIDSDKELYLQENKDGQLIKTTNVRSLGKYDFYANKGTDDKRFVLVLKAQNSQDDALLSDAQVYAVDKDVYVLLNETEASGVISVFNLLGNEIVSKEIVGNKNIISLNNSASGAYIVKVKRNNKIEASKIFIK